MSDDEVTPSSPSPPAPGGDPGQSATPPAPPLPATNPAGSFPLPDIGGLQPPAPSGSWDLDLAAASLRLDTSDTDALFEALGTKLERVLGQRVQVRRGGGFRRRARVERIVVDAGESRLEATQGRTGPTFLAAHAVRGITLQTTEITADEWLDRLVAVVRAESSRSSAVRDALGGLLQ